jgi:hypothetical protein
MATLTTANRLLGMGAPDDDIGPLRAVATRQRQAQQHHSAADGLPWCDRPAQQSPGSHDCAQC